MTADKDAILAARSMPRHEDFSFVETGLPPIDGLIQEPEERFLYWLTSKMFLGEGAVVEVGSFLGKSASALGKGLSDSGNAGVTVHCFDKFVWHREQPRLRRVLTPAPGEDFTALFLANVRRVHENVTATKVEIEHIKWSGGPIEILHLDAPKTYVDLEKCLTVFGPSLVPGRSILVLQDFFFSPSFAVPFVVAMMGEDLQLVHSMPACSTASFVPMKPIPATAPATWKYWTFPDHVVEKRWFDLMQRVDPEQRSLAEPALAFYYLNRKKPEKAREAFRQIVFSEDGQQRWEFLLRTDPWAKRARELDPR